MELLVLIVGLVVLDLLAIRFGHDSRDGFGTMARGGATSLMGWSDSTYEQELVQETKNARQRRLARGQFVDPLRQQIHDDLARAA